MGYTRIPLDKFTETFSTATGTTISRIADRAQLTVNQELSSVALGGQIISVSDEFFAEAFNLLLVEVSAIRSICSSNSYLCSPPRVSKANLDLMALCSVDGKLEGIILATIGEQK